MDPASWTLMGALQVGSAVVGVVSSIAQGNAQRDASDYNAAIADRNAVIARNNASAQAERQDRVDRMRAGANRAARGGSGTTAAGSFLDIMDDNAREDELNRLTILHQGSIHALGYESSAEQERMRGEAAQSAGYLKAGSSLLAAGAGYAGSGTTSSGSTVSSPSSYGRIA